MTSLAVANETKSNHCFKETRDHVVWRRVDWQKHTNRKEMSSWSVQQTHETSYIHWQQSVEDTTEVTEHESNDKLCRKVAPQRQQLGQTPLGNLKRAFRSVSTTLEQSFIKTSCDCDAIKTLSGGTELGRVSRTQRCGQQMCILQPYERIPTCRQIMST